MIWYFVGLVTGFFGLLAVILAPPRPGPRRPPLLPPQPRYRMPKSGNPWAGIPPLHTCIKRPDFPAPPASLWNSAGPHAGQPIFVETKVQRIMKAVGAKKGVEWSDPPRLVFDGVEVTDLLRKFVGKPEYELVEAIQERLACPDMEGCS